MVVRPVRSWISRSQRAEVLADLGVERAERLVEQQHARLDGERAGEGHPLLLAAGELRRIAAAEAAELDDVEQLLDAPRDLGPRRPQAPRTDLEAVGDVVGHRHVAEQRVMLEDEADAPLLNRERARVLAVEGERARGHRLQPGDQAEKRGLARAGRPEQRQKFAGLDAEIDRIENALRAEILRDAANLDAAGTEGASRASVALVAERRGGRRLRERI